MILTASISSSKVSLAGFEGENQLFETGMRADERLHPDEYAAKIKMALSLYSCAESVQGAIICSVMPPMTPIVRQALRRLYSVRVLTVGPGLKSGINIKIDDPAQLGADMVACAASAAAMYSVPMVLCYMDDTASTMFYIDEHKCLRGGAIMPGATLSLSALSAHTAQLPKIDIELPPKSVIGTNTVDCMKSGLIFGYAAMLDGMSERMGCTNIVATGSIAELIAPHCVHKVTYDRSLLHRGLRMIYERNTRE